MSSILPIGTGTTPVDATQLPADVRAAGPKAQQLYETALNFEQLLLQQLTQALQSTTNTDGSDDGSSDSGSDDGSSIIGSDSTTSMFGQMMPDAFAQGMTSAGGIGIARQLYDSLAPQAGITQPSPVVEPHT
jgi:Rod binding domain-containing protein